MSNNYTQLPSPAAVAAGASAAAKTATSPNVQTMPQLRVALEQLLCVAYGLWCANVCARVGPMLIEAVLARELDNSDIR